MNELELFFLIFESRTLLKVSNLVDRVMLVASILSRNLELR